MNLSRPAGPGYIHITLLSFLLSFCIAMCTRCSCVRVFKHSHFFVPVSFYALKLNVKEQVVPSATTGRQLGLRGHYVGSCQPWGVLVCHVKRRDEEWGGRWGRDDNWVMIHTKESNRVLWTSLVLNQSKSLDEGFLL